MKAHISYIFRKPDPKYKSIEQVFGHLKSAIGAQLKTSGIELKHSGAGLATLWLNLSQFQKQRNTIYHITGDVHYMALAIGKRSVLTIHDVKSVLKRSFFKQVYLKLFWFWLPALRVRRITVISEFTKKELLQIIPFAKHKITVIPNPVNTVFKKTPLDFNSDNPQLLCIGTKSNKNLERLIQALSGMTCNLHIIGELSKGQKDLLRQKGIVYKNSFNISEEKMIQAYIHCDMLCFPSTYEGFGMPIIEAQATGRPVVTSNIGAMKEVAGDSACLVDPFDINDIKNGIKKVINNTTYRNELVTKGLLNIKRFQINTIADQYLKLYKSL